MNPKRVLSFAGVELELEHASCDLCSREDTVPLTGRMRHGIDLPTVLCAGCGLCRTDPRPTEVALTRFYSELYNLFHGRNPADLNVGHPYVERSREQGLARLNRLLRFLAPEEQVRVFEIGAGVGGFLRAARTATSWEVAGVEPGEAQARLCREDLGLAVDECFLEDVQVGERWDAAVSFHVLEHVPSPRRFLRHARELLVPDGLLYLEVPNLDRPVLPLREFLQLPHLFSFSRETLAETLRAEGFRLEWLESARHVISVIARKADGAKPSARRVNSFGLRRSVLMRDAISRLAARLPSWRGAGRLKVLLTNI